MGKGSLLERLGLVRKPPLTVEEFRDRVIAEVKRRRPDLEIEPVGDAGMRTVGGGQGHVGRGYDYYLEHPRELEIVVGQLADLALHEPEPATFEQIVVLVRSARFLAAGKGEEGDRNLARPIVADLTAVVGVDAPESYRFLSASELRSELGVDDDATIWDRAFQNLRSRVDSTPPRIPTAKFVTLQTGVGLASSLLADEDFWRHPNLSNEGDLVVCPIERDQVLVARLADGELVDSLRRVAAGYRTSDFLYGGLLLRRNGAWEEFE